MTLIQFGPIILVLSNFDIEVDMGRYFKKQFIFGAFLLLAMSMTIFAAGIGLDPVFNGNGRSVFNIESDNAYGIMSGIAVASGNKFLVVGTSEIYNQYNAVTLSRYNSDGSPDASFGSGGVVITDTGLTTFGAAVAVQSDGKIVVAGNSDNYPARQTAVIRYLANGTLDTTFGTNGIYFSELDVPDDIEIQTDGKIVISGVGDVPNSDSDGVQLARINTNGTADTTFGTAGLASSMSGTPSKSDKLVIQPDGKIVVSGKTTYSNHGFVHRFNADGSADASFGTGGVSEFQFPNTTMYMGGGIELLAGGKLLVGGSGVTGVFNPNEFMLVRLNSDGSIDNTFGNAGYAFYTHPNGGGGANILVQSDGKIIMSGTQQGPNAIAVRFTAMGALDTTFGTSGVAVVSSVPNSQAYAMHLQGSNLVAVGRDLLGIYVSRIDSNGAPLSYRAENFAIGKQDTARDVAVQTDGKIVTAGFSTKANGDAVMSVARLLPNGSLDPAFGTGGKFAFNEGTTSSEAYAVKIQPDGKIVVAGRWGPNFSLSNYYYMFAARLNANGTLDTTFGTSSGKTVFQINGSLESVAYDMEFQPDGKIVMAGTARRWVGDGIVDYDIAAARLNANGTPDATFANNGWFLNATGASGNPQYERAYTLSVMPNGKILLAGSHMLRLDANGTMDTTFSSTPVILPATATDSKALADGKVLFSGGGSGDFGVSRYSGTSIDTTFGINGTATLDAGGVETTNGLYLDANGDIVVGGYSASIGQSRTKFAIGRFKSSGTPDNTFGIGGAIVTDFGGSSQIYGVTKQTDGKFVAAGIVKTGIDSDYAVVRYAPRATPFDFDGDGKTDLSIYRPGGPNGAEWWWLKSSGGSAALQFGESTDKPVAGDYTGDGKTDATFWRPSSGFWDVLRSEDFTYYGVPFGIATDIPAPADYDGDGRTDYAVFRPSNATWFISNSGGGTTIVSFGLPGDQPVNADYDGDGKSDIAIYRPNGTNGTGLAEWWGIRSSNNQVFALQFGIPGDKAVAADYTGDGKTDVAVFRPSSGVWSILRSEDLSYYAFPFGANGDLPVPGDYDGDGKMDPAVFRPSNSTWYANRSTAGILIQQFGISGDQPVPNAYVR